MPIESVYYGEQIQVNANAEPAQPGDGMGLEEIRKKLEAYKDMTAPRGMDALSLLAYRDKTESWYGARMDKKKYRIVLEDDTDESVYLKIIKLY